MLKLARLHTDKIVLLNSAAQNRYNKEYSEFMNNNKRDEHWETNSWEKINGHAEHCLVYNPKK